MERVTYGKEYGERLQTEKGLNIESHGEEVPLERGHKEIVNTWMIKGVHK